MFTWNQIRQNNVQSEIHNKLITNIMYCNHKVITVERKNEFKYILYYYIMYTLNVFLNAHLCWLSNISKISRVNESWKL